MFCYDLSFFRGFVHQLRALSHRLNAEMSMHAINRFICDSSQGRYLRVHFGHAPRDVHVNDEAFLENPIEAPNRSFSAGHLFSRPDPVAYIGGGANSSPGDFPQVFTMLNLTKYATAFQAGFRRTRH